MAATTSTILSRIETWRSTTLGELIFLRRGHDLTWRERRTGHVPVMGSAGQNGFHDQALTPGPGVVLGRSGASFGQAHYCEANFWPHNTALYVTDFRGNEPRFIYYLLDSIDFSRHNSGGAQQSLNRNFIASIALSVPLPTEQALIVKVLDDASDLISTIERSVAKKQAIKQGMMQQLLSGRTRLPGFSKPWREIRLREVARFSKGAGLPKSEIALNGSAPCIHYGELFTHYGPDIETVTSRTNSLNFNVRSEAFDVLMPTSDVTPRGLAKASAVHDAGVLLGGDILIIRTDGRDLYGPFLAYAIRRDANQVLQLVRGSTVFHIYAADMKNFALGIPCVEEQRAICSVLRDAELEINEMSKRLAKASNIKTGMMQQLLAGRTRLPIQETAA
jgi:type I restriction enzyme S subunit